MDTQNLLWELSRLGYTWEKEKVWSKHIYHVLTGGQSWFSAWILIRCWIWLKPPLNVKKILNFEKVLKQFDRFVGSSALSAVMNEMNSTVGIYTRCAGIPKKI